MGAFGAAAPAALPLQHLPPYRCSTCRRTAAAPAAVRPYRFSARLESRGRGGGVHDFQVSLTPSTSLEAIDKA
jgi:hypothetical protein